MDMYERFEQLLSKTGETASDVSKATGIAKSTFSGWKHGKFSPKKDKMERIAGHFDVPVEYFYFDDQSEDKERIRTYLDKLRLYEVSAGHGRINEGYEVYNDQNSGEVFNAVVVGDSMIPSLRDGDIVRFVSATSVDPSDYALVRINGDEVSVKHCEVTSDGLWVRGENPDAFTDRFYTVQQCITLPVQVIGKAISFERRLL